MRITHVQSLLAEEVVDVGTVSEQKVEARGVDRLHCLTHVYEPGLLLPPEDVVLAEVGVDQVALGVQGPHHLHNLRRQRFRLYP